MIEGETFERLRAWADVLDDSNYYEILGILDLADAAGVQAAFHDFALAFHPDAHSDAGEDVLAMARRVFRRGAEAYRVLSDPRLRAQYDLALARGALRLVDGAPNSDRSPGTGLKSLEDLCKSPAARLWARRADAEIGEGRLEDARRLLRQAISHEEGGSAELEERLEALELALFAMGG